MSLWVCEQMYMPSYVSIARQALHKCSCVCVSEWVDGCVGARWIISSLNEKHIQLEGGLAAHSPSAPPLLAASSSARVCCSNNNSHTQAWCEVEVEK